VNQPIFETKQTTLCEIERHSAHVDCPGRTEYGKYVSSGASQMDAAIAELTRPDSSPWGR
jgi:translation elongation factor EF-Tu-like GTPase